MLLFAQVIFFKSPFLHLPHDLFFKTLGFGLCLTQLLIDLFERNHAFNINNDANKHSNINDQRCRLGYKLALRIWTFSKSYSFGSNSQNIHLPQEGSLTHG